MAKFSAIIKSLRIERGITQEQLAALLKVSRSTIGMYETGSREPDFETLEAIADIFNVDMDYLMGRSTVERKNPVAATPIPAGFQPLPKRDRIPRVGQIACGTPSRRRMSRPTMKSPASGMPTLRCYARATAWSQKSKTAMS